MDTTETSEAMRKYMKDHTDPWKDLDTLNACPYCEGASFIMAPCPVHGGIPFNNYLEAQRVRNMQEWECEKCGETGKNDFGNVPMFHLCPDKRPEPIDISICHTPPNKANPFI